MSHFFPFVIDRGIEFAPVENVDSDESHLAPLVAKARGGFAALLEPVQNFHMLSRSITFADAPDP